MTNQTIEKAVEELDNWVKNVVEHECERIWIKAFFREALQAQRDAGAREERERIIKNLSQLRQITVNGELFISAESIKGEISNWSEYKIV